MEDIRLFLLLYADDQVIFAKSPEALQAMLLDIEHYCNAWGLKMNTAKTKTMIFEKGRHASYDFYLNNTKLEVVKSFKYLGVYFFKNEIGIERKNVLQITLPLLSIIYFHYLHM